LIAGRTVLPLLALCTLLCALAASRIARADDPRGDARAHYARGLELAAQNGYAGALREFNEAYNISPQYAVLYNIGQAHIALGQIAEAIEALTRYLRDGGDRVSPVRRAQVGRQIAWLRAELPNPEGMSEAAAARAAAAAAGAAAGAASAEASETAHGLVPQPGTLTIRCADPSLRVSLDGKHVDLAASTRGLPVAAGAHHLVLALAGRRPTEQRLTIMEGTATLVICEKLLPPLTLVPPPVPTGPPAPVPGPLSSDSGGTTATPIVHARTVGYLLGGLGLAFGGTSLGLYLWNRGQAEDAEAEHNHLPKDLNDPNHYEAAVRYDQDASAVRRTTYFSVGLAVAGVGLLAGSIYLLVRERRSDEKTGSTRLPRSWATIAPGGVAWNGVW
jgi:tetratricopeptide (TPR) repeat protein